MPKKYIALESQMLKGQGDAIHVIEIKLKRSKDILEGAISNFYCVTEKSHVKQQNQSASHPIAKAEDEFTYLYADMSN